MPFPPKALSMWWRGLLTVLAEGEFPRRDNGREFNRRLLKTENSVLVRAVLARREPNEGGDSVGRIRCAVKAHFSS